MVSYKCKYCIPVQITSCTILCLHAYHWDNHHALLQYESPCTFAVQINSVNDRYVALLRILLLTACDSFQRFTWSHDPSVSSLWQLPKFTWSRDPSTWSRDSPLFRSHYKRRADRLSGSSVLTGSVLTVYSELVKWLPNLWIKLLKPIWGLFTTMEPTFPQMKLICELTFVNLLWILFVQRKY
jgi:hypothetical protein